MSRQSTKVSFDPTFFKSLVKDSNLTMEEFIQKLKSKSSDAQMSKATLFENMKDSKISRDNLVEIGKFFNLDKKSFSLLMGHKPLPVFFRRERRAEVEENAKDKVRELAKFYFALPSYKENLKPLPVYKSLPADKLSAEIRDVLDLSANRVTFEEVISALEGFGVHVHFYPFEYLGIKKENTKNYRAASIQNKDSWLILLDTSYLPIDSLFDLFHELGHIFAGHDLEAHDEQLEEYCNAVAREILTPSAFFQTNKEYFIKAFQAPSNKVVGEVELIQEFLGASFGGVIQALDKNECLPSSTKTYLWACFHRRKNDSLTVNYIYEKRTSSHKDWALVLLDDHLSLYFSFFRKIKAGYVAERLTTRVVAQIFNVDISNADLLTKLWINETEISMEEVATFKDERDGDLSSF